MSFTNRVEFSFLGAGPRFSVEIPEEFDTVPEYSTPIQNGQGGRSFVFVPNQRVEEMDEDNVLLGTLLDRDGRRVEFFQRKADPPMWRLRWRLQQGCLFTHLREEDPDDMAETTVRSVSIVESGESVTPSLLVYPPLSYGVSTAPAYEESAVFTSSLLGEGFSAVFERPGRLRDGDAVRAEGSVFSGLAVTRVALIDGVEAQLSFGGDSSRCRSLALGIQSSFMEVTA